MTDPSSGMFCRVAESQDRLAGFTILLLHETSWSVAPICYLEDLFIASDSRRRGIGTALVNDAINEASLAGCLGIYWHTRAQNLEARQLYDRFASADDFVRYRILFEELDVLENGGRLARLKQAPDSV
jgi:GNAT superfamily N-acetyltransferase